MEGEGLKTTLAEGEGLKLYSSGGLKTVYSEGEGLMLSAGQ